MHPSCSKLQFMIGITTFDLQNSRTGLTGVLSLEQSGRVNVHSFLNWFRLKEWDVSDLSLLRCAKACLSSDVIVTHHLLSRSLLAASLISLCCGISVLLIQYNSLLLLLSLSSLSIKPTTKQYHMCACGLSALLSLRRLWTTIRNLHHLQLRSMNYRTTIYGVSVIFVAHHFVAWTTVRPYMEYQ